MHLYIYIFIYIRIPERASARDCRPYVRGRRRYIMQKNAVARGLFIYILSRRFRRSGGEIETRGPEERKKILTHTRIRPSPLPNSIFTVMRAVRPRHAHTYYITAGSGARVHYFCAVIIAVSAPRNLFFSLPFPFTRSLVLCIMSQMDVCSVHPRRSYTYAHTDAHEHDKFDNAIYIRYTRKTYVRVYRLRVGFYAILRRTAANWPVTRSFLGGAGRRNRYISGTRPERMSLRDAPCRLYAHNSITRVAEEFARKSV